MGPIFNEKVAKKWNLWVHKQYIIYCLRQKSQLLRLLLRKHLSKHTLYMLGWAARFIERPPLLLLSLATRITSAHPPPPPPPPPPLLFAQSRFRFFSATNTNNNNNIMVISIHNSHNADCLDFLSGIV